MYYTNKCTLVNYVLLYNIQAIYPVIRNFSPSVGCISTTYDINPPNLIVFNKLNFTNFHKFNVSHPDVFIYTYKVKRINKKHNSFIT